MSLALDDLLAQDEMQRLSEHLQVCPTCMTEWGKWQRIAYVLQAEPFAGPPQGFALGVDRKLQRAEQRQERILGGLVVAGGTLSIVAALLLATAAATAFWLAISPAARLAAMEYAGFARQFAVLVLQNLAALRDSVMALLPDPGALLLIFLALFAAGLLWVRLVFFGRTAGSGARR